jgi:hypothetical protein
VVSIRVGVLIIEGLVWVHLLDADHWTGISNGPVGNPDPSNKVTTGLSAQP